MGFKEKITEVSPIKISPIIKGLVITYIIAFILSLILSLVFHLTKLNEVWIGPLGVITVILSLFLGGSVAAGAASAKGLYNGLMVGIVFTVLMILSSGLGKIAWSALAIKSCYALLSSCVGGIYGVGK